MTKKLKPNPNPTNIDLVKSAISDLQRVAADLFGEFSVEHLLAAERWTDRWECIQWAVENRATVREMTVWHRSQNGLDIFAEGDDPAAPTNTESQ